jgi:hypothetical protein
MKPLKTYQPDTQTAIQIVKRHRDTADYQVRYFYSKSWEQDERQWILVRNILNVILIELGEENV